jgi:hypothetical protein
MTLRSPSFERLEESVTIIARHVDYPGNQEVVADCLDDIETRLRQGRLTREQGLRPYAILLRGASMYRPLTAIT